MGAPTDSGSCIGFCRNVVAERMNDSRFSSPRGIHTVFLMVFVEKESRRRHRYAPLSETRHSKFRILSESTVSRIRD